MPMHCYALLGDKSLLFKMQLIVDAYLITSAASGF